MVELCLWGLRCLLCGAWFCLVQCSSSGSGSLCCFPCRRLPLGVSTFLTTSACCAGGVSWAATHPWYSPVFTYSGHLAVVRWVLHPVSGCSLWLRLLVFRLWGGALWLPVPLGLCWVFCHLLQRFSAYVGCCAMFTACFHLP